jgi:hypothetical protein
MWLVAGLALAASAGLASGVELLAVSEPDASALDDASVNPWRIFAVSSDRSEFNAGMSSLRVKLAAGDRASSTRSIGLDAPAGIVCRFNLSLSGGGDGRETEQVLRIGAGFGNANTDEPDVNTFGRLGVRSTNPAQGFELRDLVARKSSATFSGTQAITWALNQTGRTVHYAAPDGTLEPVADNRMDVWVGRTKVFDDMAVTRAGVALTDLKWYWGSGSGITSLDHLDVVPLEDGVAGEPAPVPVAVGESSLGNVPPPSGPALELYRPSPNPFARTTRFAYAISAGTERVEIGVFDVAGRKVRGLISGAQPAGRYEVAWDGRNDAGDHVRDGIYFLRASIGSAFRMARIAYLVK